VWREKRSKWWGHVAMWREQLSWGQGQVASKAWSQMCLGLASSRGLATMPIGLSAATPSSFLQKARETAAHERQV
jgi:hypothetical protein